VRRHQLSEPWQDGVQARVEAFHELIRVPVPPTSFVPFTCSETLTAVEE
jgi:hypothetical protein